MYLPKLGDASTLLWFVSGIGLLEQSRYLAQLGGVTCYLAMAVGAAPLPQSKGQGRAPLTKTDDSGRELYLN